mmetsp:Transcript_30363/g.103179  ORF Transcript_30363/g.103179 Transcript_30363/m.103179 type:complete len:225 (+) Transcript_30363:692-1366(+)
MRGDSSRRGHAADAAGGSSRPRAPPHVPRGAARGRGGPAVPERPLGRAQDAGPLLLRDRRARLGAVGRGLGDVRRRLPRRGARGRHVDGAGAERDHRRRRRGPELGHVHGGAKLPAGRAASAGAPRGQGPRGHAAAGRPDERPRTVSRPRGAAARAVRRAAARAALGGNRRRGRVARGPRPHDGHAFLHERGDGRNDVGPARGRRRQAGAARARRRFAQARVGA